MPGAHQSGGVRARPVLTVGIKLNGGVFEANLTDANEHAGTYTGSGFQFPLTFHR